MGIEKNNPRGEPWSQSMQGHPLMVTSPAGIQHVVVNHHLQWHKPTLLTLDTVHLNTRMTNLEEIQTRNLGLNLNQPQWLPSVGIGT